ncbi:hypothetical protein IY40_25110 [Serratia marcescens]|uniref:hypothetical protein n=1 Tax=Serratia marcescens TaxID=615 RepID=UPI0004E71B7E|nr:hypothetical protein [Serratia marcescens]KFF76271.1 hypothetical protein IY40_25110 [Serratia marcescens]
MAEDKKTVTGKKVDINVLKAAFKEGATPNESDYHDLIELASLGSKALGALSENATAPKPGAGLTYSADKLAIHAGPGISAGKDGVTVNVDKNTLDVSHSGVALKLSPLGGLSSGVQGLHVKTGAGLKTDKDGLTVALAEKSGLTTASSVLGIAINEHQSGLGFDSKGALEVKLASDNQYIERTGQGLSINEKGIKKIKEVLQETSLVALQRAVHQTESGAKKETQTANKVERDIASALNTAYDKGYAVRRQENQLVVQHPSLSRTLSYPSNGQVKILDECGVPKRKGQSVVCLPGHTGLGGKDKLESNVLYLSGAQVGQRDVDVLVLAAGPDKNNPQGGLAVAGATITVKVTVEPRVGNTVSLSPSGTVQVGTSLTASFAFDPEADNAATYQWEYQDDSEWKAVSGATGKTWTPPQTYVNQSIRVTVTPASKALPNKQYPVVHSEPVSLQDTTETITKIVVNGHIFQGEALKGQGRDVFPTTGFLHACFSLIPPNGDATQYTWIASATWVTMGENGRATFTGKGDNSEVTIIGTPKSGQGGRVEYRFRLKKWFTNLGSQTMTWEAANQACQNCKE